MHALYGKKTVRLQCSLNVADIFLQLSVVIIIIYKASKVVTSEALVPVNCVC